MDLVETPDQQAQAEAEPETVDMEQSDTAPSPAGEPTDQVSDDVPSEVAEDAKVAEDVHAPQDVILAHPLAGQGEDITPNKDGGLKKAIIKASEKTESPMKGDHVEVHYIGTLLDGTKFDSSRDRGEKFTFTLGEGQVIKAWDIGIATMKIGEVCVLTCRPEYAYGKKAQGKIPSDSTLVFEVELFSFEGEDLSADKDKGILRRIIEAGDGWKNPNPDSTVDVHLTGIYEDNTFEDRDVKFVIGEGSEQGVVSGIEQALQKMKKGEKADLTLSANYAFGRIGKEEFNIPASVSVKYQVHLKDFESAKEPWEMDLSEKLESSEVTKAKGTEQFKAGNYTRAIKQYKKIVDYLASERETQKEEEQTVKCDQLLLAGYLNLAMCYIKMGDDVEAIDVCDQALEIDNKNEKGYFRRGSARLSQNEFELAADDFRKVLELGPNNKAARNQLTLITQKLKAQKDRDKKIYGNMFAKFAEQDSQAEAKRKAEQTKKPETKPVPDETENIIDEDLEMEEDAPKKKKVPTATLR